MNSKFNSNCRKIELSAKGVSLVNISYTDQILIISENCERGYVFHILGNKIRYFTQNDIYCIHYIQVSALLMLTFYCRCYVFHVLVKTLLQGKKCMIILEINTISHGCQKDQKSS